MKARKGEIGPFPADVKPVRPGVYRIQIPSGFKGYAYFSGKHWCNSSDSVDGALSWITYGERGAIQSKIWCGLAKEPK